MLAAAHSIRSAMDVIFALLVDGGSGVRERQLASIDETLGGDHRERVEAMLKPLSRIDPRHRLPLVELSLPALKRRPRSALRLYLKTIEKLIHADGDINSFEFAISRLVRVYLIEAMDPESDQDDNRELREVRREVAVLLSVLARAGHTSESDARRAFIAGWHHLFPSSDGDYQPPRDWVDAATDALDRLDELAPLFKEELIAAMLRTLSHDNRITLDELELLRATCAALHCPMPPTVG